MIRSSVITFLVSQKPTLDSRILENIENILSMRARECEGQVLGKHKGALISNEWKLIVSKFKVC